MIYSEWKRKYAIPLCPKADEKCQAQHHYKAIPLDRHAPVLTETDEDAKWEQPEINHFGRVSKVPRLCALFFAQSGTPFDIEGIEYKASVYPPIVFEQKCAVQKIMGVLFMTAFAVKLRNGEDSLGYHTWRAWNAKNPVAFLLFGQSRHVLIRHADKKRSKRIQLHGGSLLSLDPCLGSEWSVSIPKSKKYPGTTILIIFQ